MGTSHPVSASMRTFARSWKSTKQKPAMVSGRPNAFASMACRVRGFWIRTFPGPSKTIKRYASPFASSSQSTFAASSKKYPARPQKAGKHAKQQSHVLNAKIFIAYLIVVAEDRIKPPPDTEIPYSVKVKPPGTSHSNAPVR